MLGSLIRGYDQETYDKFMKEEAYEEGRQDLIKTLLKNYEPPKVAEMLELSVDQVQAVIEK